MQSRVLKVNFQLNGMLNRLQLKTNVIAKESQETIQILKCLNSTIKKFFGRLVHMHTPTLRQIEAAHCLKSMYLLSSQDIKKFR